MRYKTPKELNKLAKEIRRENENWWIDLKTRKPIQRSKGELQMLVITELAEAMQGIRKDLMDDHLPHRKMEEVEMADAAIRILDLAGGFGFKFHPVNPNINIPENKGEALLSIAWSIQTYSLSYAIAQIQAYCHQFKLDLWTTVAEKRGYNQSREDHKIENRMKKGGKKL